MCREFPPALLSEVITATKSVCGTSLPWPATVIAAKAACPAVEEPRYREEVAPGSHWLVAAVLSTAWGFPAKIQHSE